MVGHNELASGEHAQVCVIGSLTILKILVALQFFVAFGTANAVVPDNEWYKDYKYYDSKDAAQAACQAQRDIEVVYELPSTMYCPTGPNFTSTSGQLQSVC